MIDGLVTQTEGELKEENFLPRRSQDSHCAFTSLFVLAKDGRLSAINRRQTEELVSGWGSYRRTPWESARSFMNQHWRFNKEEPVPCSCGASSEPKPSSWDNLYQQIATHGLTITCMPFQDVWNIDLERLKRCCGHVVTPNRQIIPFCAYYLTSVSGERLYPNYLTETATSK